MKTMKKYILVAFLFTSIVNFANTTTTFDNIKRVKLEFSSVKKGHFLHIKNEDGNVIYTEEIENTGTFSKIFDLSVLENGMFTAELTKDFEIKIKPFKVENGVVTFEVENQKTIFKPIIRVKEDKILVSKYNFEANKISVSIYFENTLIHSEFLECENTLNRIFGVSKEKKGNYTVVVNADNRMYVEKFRL